MEDPVQIKRSHLSQEQKRWATPGEHQMIVAACHQKADTKRTHKMQKNVWRRGRGHI